MYSASTSPLFHCTDFVISLFSVIALVPFATTNLDYRHTEELVLMYILCLYLNTKIRDQFHHQGFTLSVNPNNC